MDLIFKKDINNNIIPKLKLELKKSDIQNFIIYLKNNKTNEYINYLIEIMKKSPEIGQILIDINDLYKMNGIIECLIEKYIYESDENNLLKNFFVFISKSFQIGKNIYDHIFKQIGKLIQKSLNSFINENNINKKSILERCINLLMIFYDKKDDNFLLMNNFFYLYKNSIKSNINLIDFKSINIGMCFFIDEFYENNKSIISKINFPNKDVLLIRLLQKNKFEIFINNEKINDCDIKLKENYWNFLQIKIMNNSIIIIINSEMTIKCNNKININEIKSFRANKINIEKGKLIKNDDKLDKIIKLLFYKNFNGIVSPIIISDNDINLEEYLSSKFSNDTKNLIFKEKENNKDEAQNINENKENNFTNYYNIPFIISIIKRKKRIINPIFDYYSKNKKLKNSEIKRSNSSYLIFEKKRDERFFENNKYSRYYNEIKSIQKIFYSNDDFKIQYKNLTKLNFIKKIFPYFYFFENLFFKDNIFLLGGIKNLLPLFEIMMELDKKEITNNILKIFKILELILFSENNIEDAINSHFFEILSTFLENLILNNKVTYKRIALLIKNLFKYKYHQNEIYFGFKSLLLNKNILCDINENESILDILIEFENRKEIFHFLITFMKNNKDIEEEFLNKIFKFIYQYLILNIDIETENSNKESATYKGEKFENIKEIFLLMSNKEINDNIIIKSLNLLINIFNIKIDKEIINEKQIVQQNNILKLLNNYIQDNSNFDNQNLVNNDNKKTNIEKLLLSNIEILSYLIENQFMYFLVELSKSNNINIKFKLLHFNQIIFFYYININGILSKYNLTKLLNLYETQKKTIEKEDYNSINVNNQFFEELTNFSKIQNDNNYNNNNFFNNTEFNAFIISDFNNLLRLSLNFTQKEEYYLYFHFPQIINLIKDFISSTINLHFFQLVLSKFWKINNFKSIINENIKNNFEYIDLYNSKSFIIFIIQIMHHIYIIYKEIKNKELKEINENIFEIIFQIYLNSIELNSLNFLNVLKEFNNYIFSIYKIIEDEKKDEKTKNELIDFIKFFFKNISNKINDFKSKNKFEKNVDFLNQFMKDLLKDENFGINNLSKLAIKKFKKDNDFQLYISSFPYDNLEYLIINKFLIFFEMLLTAPSELKLKLNYFTLLLIFCILLSTNKIEDSSFSKSLNYDFFIELILLSIRSIFLYINENNLHLIQLFIQLISLISFYFEKNKNNYFIEYLKILGINSEFITFINYYFKISKVKNNDFLEKEIKKNRDSLNFLQTPDTKIINLKLFYHIIIENLFLEKPKKKLNSSIMNENSMYNNLMLKKYYRKLRKQLFSWNNSYSDLNLFYNEKDSLKYKILNHYSEEMTLPLLIPILNLNSFLPKGFSEFFNKRYSIIDIIDKSPLDDDILKIIKTIENNINNLQILEKKDILNNTNKHNINNDNQKDKNNETIIQNNNESIIEQKILEYFGIKNKDIYSCCLLKPGLHIKGYFIFNNDNSFDFLGFPRKLVDKNNYYINSKSDICYGSLRQCDKFSYLHIKIKDITYIYKRNYAFKDDSLEIFTKQKKSYYFIFNNIGNKINLNNNAIFENKVKEEFNISKNIRDYIYYCLLEEENFQNNNNNFFSMRTINKKKNEKNDDLFKSYEIVDNKKKQFRYKYKGKDSKYNDLNSILQSYYDNSISKLEMLMRINLLSNRSFNDINQYPIFPWIINNYQTKYTFEKLPLTENEILNNLRPLNKPMGVLNEERFKPCQIFYDSIKEEFIENYGDSIPLDFSDFSKFNSLNIELENIPIYYDSHYSNPSYVCYYLVRLFPYSISAQLIQGDVFNYPDRLFINLEKSHYNTINKRSDLRELIPEFYYLPELFRNINHFYLGNLQSSKDEDSTYQLIKKLKSLNNEISVDDVLLPNYCDNNPEKYISIIREIFERPEIKINDWIDLIFGYAQKGKEALKRKNIFSPFFYEGYVNLEKYSNQERDFYLQNFEKGVHPTQILTIKMNEKKYIKNILKSENNDDLFNDMNKIEIDNEIELNNNEFYNCGIITNRMKYNLKYYKKNFENSHFEIIFYKNNIYNCGVLALEINVTLNQFEKKSNIKYYNKEFFEMINNQKSIYEFNNEFNDEKFKKIQKYLIECIIVLSYKIFININNISELNQSIKIQQYSNEIVEITQFLKKLNHNDYNIKINNKIGIIYNFLLDEVYIILFNKYKNPIDLRKTIKTKSGILTYKLDNSEITYFSIDKFIIFGTKLGSIIIYDPEEENIVKIIHFHTKRIVCIQQNNILNLMISSSEDGYINIYTLPTAILINSIFLPSFICDNIFISYSPLPSFIIYNKEKEIFKSFSINGRSLLKKDKKITNIKEMKMQKNEYFIEYLDIYNGKISKCYELPFLDEIKININDNLKNRILRNQKELKERILKSKKFYKVKIGTKKKEKLKKTAKK